MVATMAKKPKKPSGEQERNSDRHQYPVMSIRPSTPMQKLLQRMAKEQRRSASQTIILLLEEILTQKGLWPPTDEEQE
jgi:hypothetical protein